METGLSKKKIKESIIKMHNYLKTQDYYEDINSYALYTDDGYMSITMIFNTNSYLDKKKDDKYYLTYKYSPAEWYSEILKSDSLIYGNTFFDEISCFLKERALSGGDNEKNVIDDCIEALKDIRTRQLEKGEESAEFSKMAAIMGEEIEETGDFVVNEKDKVVNLTEAGVKKVEDFFHIENLADPENLEIQHNMILALRANYLMFRDQDYFW